MQYHVLSFEGPDDYARAGGLATRVEGLTETLARVGVESHLWFIGDPDLPAEESQGRLHLHRWAQWISAHHPGGVYDGEFTKRDDFTRSLPSHLVDQVLAPYLSRGGRAVVLAEEWHTADAVIRLDALLRKVGLRSQVHILWNANNTFGFEHVNWERLAAAATITTVSRYMKHRMREWDVEALVIPNGLPEDAFEKPDREGVRELQRRFHGRTLLTKMARWDPDKRWLSTVALTADLKDADWKPLLIARGGSEPHGHEVLAAAWARGLKVVDCHATRPGVRGLLEALDHVNGADVVNLRSYVDPVARRMLFRGSDAVLANSGHEPFGLVGLETMAAGGLACTGCSGEDYAVPGQNAVVLETDDPREFVGMFRRLRARPDEARAVRRAGRSTARRYAWEEVVERVLLPRVEIHHPDS